MDQLRAALRSLAPQTPVWRGGMPQWMPASSLPELQPAPAMPAPRPAFPAPPPPMAPMGMYAPAPAVAASYAPARSEEPTLNPLVLSSAASPPPGGSREAEFAIAYFAPLVVIAILYLVAFAVGGGLASTDSQAGEAAGGVVFLVVMVPILILSLVGTFTGVVASIRRCHDLGQSGWLTLLTFVPCVNFGFLLYLLFAPGKPGAAMAMQPAAGGSKTGIIVVVAVAGLSADRGHRHRGRHRHSQPAAGARLGQRSDGHRRHPHDHRRRPPTSRPTTDYYDSPPVWPNPLGCLQTTPAGDPSSRP